MSFQASSTKERYIELKKDPVLFCKYDKEARYSYNGMYNVGAGWYSCDSTIQLFIGEQVLHGEEFDRKLFVINYRDISASVVERAKEDTDTIFFEVTEFDANNKDHWCSVFMDCAYNYHSGNTTFCQMALIWALYTTDWKIDVIRDVCSLMSGDVSNTCINYICYNLSALSLRKQKLLLNVLKGSKPNINYIFYKDVEDALKELSPNGNFDDYGLFKKVDYVIYYGSNADEWKHLEILYKSSSNKFIKFKNWLSNSNQRFYNYNDLEEIHSFVNSSTQLSLVKRYLHDVRVHNVEIDYDFIKTLRDVKYSGLFYSRYFIEKSGDNIDLSALLFCDVLLTLKINNGTKLQDFNGILDFAVKHSNSAYPNIDLGIRKFLPICDGGLKPNPQFYGFIHYSLIYTFDESLLTKENLLRTVEFIFNKAAEIQKHYCCSCEDDKHLDENEKMRCSSVLSIRRRINKDGKQEVVKEKVQCQFMQLKPWIPYKWKRKNGYDQFLKLCLDIDTVGEFFTIENADLNRLKMSIRSWAERTNSVNFDNGLMPDEYKEYDVVQHFIYNYYSPVKIVIFPNKNVYYSSKKDLLGIWPDKDSIIYNDDEMEYFAQKSESSYVYNKTFQTLKEMYPDGVVGEDHVIIPYDVSELRKVKDYFYYKSYIRKDDTLYSNNTNNKDNNKNQNNPFKFLFTPQIDKDRIFYCTPKLADTKEKVSELPFFWCRSEECFCNMLDNQTLDKQSNWKFYSLYHAAEIIGCKLIQETDNGNVPDPKVTDFAVEVRQAERLYARLVCRGCGHMIFSTRGSLLNGSRFFACQNPSCKQNKVEVYLSQCNNCKTGLIDSRDSKKCENGWVICPSCLACCNDNLFNSLIARHNRNGNIPARIKANEGKGHNNKGQFFCPKCGTKLGKIIIEQKEKGEDGSEIIVDKEVFGCPTCKRSYEKELKIYKNPLSKYENR
jgi:hypothetical protein